MIERARHAEYSKIDREKFNNVVEMTENIDKAHKDNKYFIDGRTYNCPFCNRRSVAFMIVGNSSFDWSIEKKCYLYLVRCKEIECQKTSFHLSNYSLKQSNLYDSSNNKREYYFAFPFETEEGDDQVSEKDELPLEMDEVFFHHTPSSFFTIDSRIPGVIRIPIDEAENCRINGYLTGGSACLRKAIYKFLQNQGIPDSNESGEFLRYEDRYDLLEVKIREQFPYIDIDYLRNLKNIHAITSREVHEDEWQDFDNNTLRFLIALTKDILNQVYVLPKDRQAARDRVLNFRPPNQSES